MTGLFRGLGIVGAEMPAPALLACQRSGDDEARRKEHIRIAIACLQSLDQCEQLRGNIDIGQLEC